MNSVFNEQILADKLSKLNSTQQCIESILSNRFHAYFSQFYTLLTWNLQTSVDIWEQRRVFGSRARGLKELMLGSEPPPTLELNKKRSRSSVKIIRRDSRSVKIVRSKSFVFHIVSIFMYMERIEKKMAKYANVMIPEIICRRDSREDCNCTAQCTQ
ncbi:hypothetical protein GW17_00009752 [Ensete ventricosum]|nr:hypothetical protein GW17_00009752 [Ensete ventricosum]